ncbi:arabinogalactan O-methyltransferase 2 [Typha angustifolia]|uniref:arabinogalactan O-methyltransferase 2 n=1 Tax=Typha angustifolia TaxID=59011 RepID=UPI003C2C45F3
MFRSLPAKPLFIAAAAAAALVAGALLISSFLRLVDRPSLLCLPSSFSTAGEGYSSSAVSELAAAAMHYATSSVVPQQSFGEISISHAVLRRRSPCNFLVFGLGHDSRLWSALNPGGATLFLEEDPEWFKSVMAKTPTLNAAIVRYRTRLDEADRLLKTYKSEPDCLPPRAYLKGNQRCRLALANLPAEVYEREWDAIMIDAPKGYFASAPGRMAAIYSAAVMARNRRGAGDTDVFLHDVNRNVEKVFAMEFLCAKYRVGGVGRLWHFRIPPAANGTEAAGGFC